MKTRDTGRERFCPTCDRRRPTVREAGPGEQVESCKRCGAWLIKWPAREEKQS